MDFTGLLDSLVAPIIGLVKGVLAVAGVAAAVAVVVFAAGFLASLRVLPWRITYRGLVRAQLRSKIYDLIRWIIVDLIRSKASRKRDTYPGYGLLCFVGLQGQGKTQSLVARLAEIRKAYPRCIIVTNFACKYADRLMQSWDDFFSIRNGYQGVVFALDELQSEYSSAQSKFIPDNLLREISQLRKQRIQILATTQYFSRLAKPLREQTHRVAVCSGRFRGRWVSVKEYDALQYSLIIDNPDAAAKKLEPVRKYSYIASDELRHSYDTYEKIKRMKKISEQQQQAEN